MNHEQPSRKRQTVPIKLPPKPAAPQHPLAAAPAIRLGNGAPEIHSRHSCFLFPLVQVTVASVLSVMVLDFGECSHIVASAALGYVGGLMMMAPRRNTLTSTDEFLIRWGFVFLCIISAVASIVIWSLRK